VVGLWVDVTSRYRKADFSKRYLSSRFSIQCMIPAQEHPGGPALCVRRWRRVEPSVIALLSVTVIESVCKQIRQLCRIMVPLFSVSPVVMQKHGLGLTNS
jgi:hypothetical protein